MKFAAYWDAGYGCSGSQQLSGVWANETDALKHARFIIGGHVTHVRQVS
jgi:hypothetical protein